jgi:hypothetical protein
MTSTKPELSKLNIEETTMEYTVTVRAKTRAVYEYVVQAASEEEAMDKVLEDICYDMADIWVD